MLTSKINNETCVTNDIFILIVYTLSNENNTNEVLDCSHLGYYTVQSHTTVKISNPKFHFSLCHDFALHSGDKAATYT
jgi:hypothetical protein